MVIDGDNKPQEDLHEFTIKKIPSFEGIF